MSDEKALFRRNGEKAVCGRGRNEGYVLKNVERGTQEAPPAAGGASCVPVRLSYQTLPRCIVPT